MNLFELGYPTDWVASLVLSTVVQTTVVIAVAAVLVKTLFRRRPEMGHAIWLTALVYVVLSPVVAFCIARTDVVIWEIPLAYLQPSSGQNEPRSRAQRRLPVPSPPGKSGHAAGESHRDAVEERARSEIGAFVNRSQPTVMRELHEATPTRVTWPKTGTTLSVWNWYNGRVIDLLCGAAYLIWILGGLLLGFRLLYGWRLVRTLRTSCQWLDSREFESLFRSVSETLSLRDLPPIATSSAVQIPVVAGMWRPIILLPERMTETFSREQLHEMLVHECAHIVRRDPYVAFLQRLAGMVFWPHPLVYLLNRNLSRAREELCDNYVLRQCSPHNYAQTLLAVAQSCALMKRPLTPPTHPMTQLALVTPHWKLEHRIAGLLDESRSRATSAAWVPAVAAGLLLCTFGTAISATRLQAVDQPTRQQATASTRTAEPNAYRKETSDPSTPFLEDSRGVAVGISKTEGIEIGDPDGIPSGSNRNGDAVDTDLYGDPLPAGASTRLGTVRFRHPGWNKNVAFAGDPKVLLSCSDDNVIRYWETRTGKLLREVHVDKQEVRALRVSPDGKTAATLGFRFVEEDRSNYRNIKLWDVATGKLRKTIRWPSRPDCDEFEFLPDGATIVTGNRDGLLRFFDVASGEEGLKHQSSKQGLDSLAVSPDGQSIAFSGRNTLQLWNWLAGEEPVDIDTGRARIVGLTFSPDGRLLAAGPDSRKVVQMWDVKSRKIVRTFSCEPQPGMFIDELLFTPDGKSLLAADYIGYRDAKKSVIHWDVESGKIQHRYTADSMELRCLDISRDGRWLAAAEWGTGMAVWDLQTGKRMADDPIGHVRSVPSIRFWPDGQLAATASDDGTIRTWDATSGRPLLKMQHDYWIRAMELSPDGKFIASSSLDDTVRLWDAKTGKEVLRLPGHGRLGGHRALAFLADGTRLVSWGDDMDLHVWEVPSGKQLHQHELRPGGVKIPEDEKALSEKFEELSDSIGPFGLSRDGTTFCLMFKNVIYVYNVDSGAELLKIDSEFRIRSIAVSPDGKRMLTAGTAAQPTTTKLVTGGTRYSGAKAQAIRLFDLESGREIWKHDLPEGGTGPITFSPDGQWMSSALGLPVQKIMVWSVGSQQNLLQIDIKELSQKYYYRGLAISPDGRKLALGTADASVLIWDLPGLGLHSLGQ